MHAVQLLSMLGCARATCAGTQPWGFQKVRLSQGDAADATAQCMSFLGKLKPVQAVASVKLPALEISCDLYTSRDCL